MKTSAYRSISVLLFLGLSFSLVLPSVAQVGPPPVDASRLPPQGLSAYGWTRLHWLARTGSADSIRTGLAEGLDVHARDKYNRPPLHLAVLAVNPETVRALLDAGADVNAKDQWGVTPLRRAELLEETRGWNMVEVSAVLREYGGTTPERPTRRSLPVK